MGRSAWTQVASRSPLLLSPDRPSHSRTSSLPGIRFRRRWESQLSGDLSACWCHFLPPALSLRSWAPGRGERLGPGEPWTMFEPLCASPTVAPWRPPTPLAGRASRTESPPFLALHVCAQPPTGSGPFRSWPAARSPGGRRHSRPCPDPVTHSALQLTPPGPGLTHSQSLPVILPCGSI